MESLQIVAQPVTAGPPRTTGPSPQALTGLATPTHRVNSLIPSKETPGPRSRSTRRSIASLAERIGQSGHLPDPIIAALQKRGFESPYLRHHVVARINPVRFHRATKGDDRPPMPLPAALIRMAAAAKRFDFSRVNPSELALVAAVAE